MQRYRIAAVEVESYGGDVFGTRAMPEEDGEWVKYKDIERLEDELATAKNKAVAYEETSKRLDEAQHYCQKHCFPQSWGKNVWHAILDDAKRMRGEDGKE